MKSLLLVLNVISSTKTRSFVRMVLEGAGHRVVEANGCAQAQALLQNGLDPDLVFCDALCVNSVDFANTREILKYASARNVCLITKISDREAVAREVAALGVKYLLAAPVTRGDVENVIDQVSRKDEDSVFGLAQATQDESELIEGFTSPSQKCEPAGPYIEELGGNNFFLAMSPRMREIHRQVNLLADIDVNVLILGESGTGKEVIAQLIHQNSRRSRERFLKVNCAALPADLLESELFGHRQGAFTGAVNDRAGKFEQANRGTLLLDEIGEVPVHMQAKLLHVLQDGQFARLGAQETTRVDVRVLAATNIQMEDALQNKTFREDLYYRLSVFTIKVPPLRERREEIPYLMEETIRRTPAEIRKGFATNLPSRLLDMALIYDWRGNLRELRNFVMRTIVMRDVDSATRELEAKVASQSTPAPQPANDEALSRSGIRSVVRDIKERTEMEMIQSALETFGWNRRRAAQHLNISYRSLLYKIQQHRLRPWAGDARASGVATRSVRSTAL